MEYKEEYEILNIFPTLIYMANRGLNLSPEEEEEIVDVIKGGMQKNIGNIASNDTYIFDTKLKNLKKFCEQHIKTYVEQIINPKEDLDFYITQSWLSVTKPDGYHHAHRHANSIISGTFYVSTEEDDKIIFTDPRPQPWQIKFEPKEYDIRNSPEWWCTTLTNGLILFPSWLTHSVKQRCNATTDKISISFNTFVRGPIGEQSSLTELIL